MIHTKPQESHSRKSCRDLVPAGQAWPLGRQASPAPEPQSTACGPSTRSRCQSLPKERPQPLEQLPEAGALGMPLCGLQVVLPDLTPQHLQQSLRPCGRQCKPATASKQDCVTLRPPCHGDANSTACNRPPGPHGQGGRAGRTFLKPPTQNLSP